MTYTLKQKVIATTMVRKKIEELGWMHKLSVIQSLHVGNTCNLTLINHDIVYIQMFEKINNEHLQNKNQPMIYLSLPKS